MIPQCEQKKNFIVNEEIETGKKRNGKMIFSKEIEINIGTDIEFDYSITNIQDIDELWIDFSNSYINSNSVILFLCQYHNTEDWNRVYISEGHIYFDFGQVYSNFEKMATITILYTKK